MTVTDRDELATTTGAESAPRVFVSHASPDAAVAQRMVAALEGNGIRCWIAPRDVPAGAQYADAEDGEIGHSRNVGYAVPCVDHWGKSSFGHLCRRGKAQQAPAMPGALMSDGVSETELDPSACLAPE